MCAQSICLQPSDAQIDVLVCSHIGAFVSSEEIFVSLWHDLTAGLIYEMVTASQLSITLKLKTNVFRFS